MIIQSKQVWVSSTFIEAQLEIVDAKITGIYPYGTKPVDKDYGEDRILPGMIDIHCHGGLGFDTNDANHEGLRTWAAGLAKEGITGFLPTTVTQSEEVLTKALINVTEVVDEATKARKSSAFISKAHILTRKTKARSRNSSSLRRMLSSSRSIRKPPRV